MSTSLSEQAAAAAEARLRANGMSVGALRTELDALGVDCRSAIEKLDLVALYVRAKKFPHDAQQQQRPARPATPKPRTVPIPKAAAATPMKMPAMPALPFEVNWPNAIMAFVFIMYVYSNFISPSSSAVGGGDAASATHAGYPGGLRQNAYLIGEILDVGTDGEFQNILKQHEEDSGLPVVVDFYSQSCGPCRMIGRELERSPLCLFLLASLQLVSFVLVPLPGALPAPFPYLDLQSASF